MKTCLCLLLVTLFLAGCGDSKARYVITPAEDSVQTRLSVSSIEVRDVSLPAYASASEIIVENPDGALQPVAKAIWADDPLRAVTGALAQSLDVKSTAIVAAEPWPLSEAADIQLTVRVDQMIARADGTFAFSGQFAISSSTGAWRDRLQRFVVVVPMADTSAAAVAEATGRAIDGLADEVLALLKQRA